MLVGQVLEFEDLKRISKKAKPSSVRKWLEDQGIPYFGSGDDLCTTVGLIEAARLRVDVSGKYDPNVI